MDELSKAEIEELDAAIDKYKNVDTKTLSELSHDSAWHEAWDKNHNAVMTSLNIAKAGDASNEFLEYLRNRNLRNNRFRMLKKNVLLLKDLLFPREIFIFALKWNCYEQI